MQRLRRLETVISTALAEGRPVTPLVQAQLEDLAEYVLYYSCIILL